MKKSSLFIAVGAVVLSCAAFLSTKANHKFTGVKAVYGKIGTVPFTLITPAASAAIFTTVKGTLKTAFIKTLGNTKLSTLFSTASLVNKVYYF